MAVGNLLCCVYRGPKSHVKGTWPDLDLGIIFPRLREICTVTLYSRAEKGNWSDESCQPAGESVWAERYEYR